MYKIKCKYCKNEIYTNNPHQKLCGSKQCRRAYQREWQKAKYRKLAYQKWAEREFKTNNEPQIALKN